MSKKNILIVDDSTSIRQVLKFTLQNAGFNVVEGVDGQDAVKQLTSFPDDFKVSLIISDVNMPIMDGLTFLKKVKEDDTLSNFRFTPVVMLTTEGSSETKNIGREWGAKAWVTKPFAPEQVLKVVEKLLM